MTQSIAIGAIECCGGLAMRKTYGNYLFMNGDNKVVGLWPRRENMRDNSDSEINASLLDFSSPIVSASLTSDGEANTDDQPRRRRFADWIVMAICAVWLGLVSAVYLPGWFVQPPSFEALVIAIAAAAAPLGLVILVYNAVTGNDERALRSAQNAASIIRGEQLRLEKSLSAMTTRLRQHQSELVQTNETLMTLGEDAANRLKLSSTSMRDDIETLTKHGQSLKFSATAARADMAVLLANLPKAQVETRKIVRALQETGASAEESTRALSALMGSLIERGREADAVAIAASQKLAGQLDRIEAVSQSGGDRLTSTARDMAESVDNALAHADQANHTIRSGINAQSAALTALVDQSQSAIARTGADAAAAMGARVEDISVQLQSLAALMAGQTAQAATLLGGIREGLDAARVGLNALDKEGLARAGDLSVALAGLDEKARGLGQSLETGNNNADALITRTESLITALDAALREIDESLPGAFQRIDARVASTAPVLHSLSGVAGDALDRLMEADSVLARQRTTLGEITTEAERYLAVNINATSRLSTALDDATAKARTLVDTTSIDLGAALINIENASQSAKEKAHNVKGVNPAKSLEALSADAKVALQGTITAEIERQIEALGASAQLAVSSANAASERLTQQLTAITEISGSIEQRLAEGQASIEKTDSEALSRRVSLLIDSLNSTAIDVNKLLSNDVTDTSWAAYLRGDRGTFTRRAVKLLDAGDARDVLHHYETQPDFQDHVNRYIRDFELMLRDILSTRDGSALAITLLSSDMGKLYVALAQAIDRLRKN
jgi:hypothetical protein